MEGEGEKKIDTAFTTLASVDSDPVKPQAVIKASDLDEAASLLARNFTLPAFTPEQNRKLLKKLDLHILPMMLALYLLQFLSKTSLGLSTLLNLKAETNLSQAEYNILSTIFYVSYLAFEFPQSLGLQRYPVGKYLAVNIFAWSVLILAHAACSDFTGLVIVRLLLGIAEGSVTPGFMIITSIHFRGQSARVALEGTAFRHGDIDDILATIVKKTGLIKNSKFTPLDIKRIYFGSWLADYSQAMDIMGIKKLGKQSIINLICVLSFLSFGLATREFEITEERVGVYLPISHIDNPKGYAKDGDPRLTDSRLRGPVDPRELEIDPQTGMKNYIRNESLGFDTSSALVRSKIRDCITIGRRARNGGGDEDTFLAYRILGQLLHTLEDFTAHSNWIELSLLRLGYSNIFPYVGSNVVINSPGGTCYPLVTGTFGGPDFINSLLGEAGDTISQTNVSDIDAAVSNSNADSNLSGFLSKLSGSGNNNLTREMNDFNEIREKSSAGKMEMSPKEMHETLFKLLTFRDDLVKTISKAINAIGLSDLAEAISNAVSKWVLTILQPLLKPLTSTATKVLFQSSGAVLSNDSDQFAVFNDGFASDPTHSFLSKDHFSNVLNEPAGKVAVVIVKSTVEKIVAAWEDVKISPDSVANYALEALHHPYFYNANSEVQRLMALELKTWIESLSSADRSYTLNALTKESVRNHKNVRKGYGELPHHDSCGPPSIARSFEMAQTTNYGQNYQFQNPSQPFQAQPSTQYYSDPIGPPSTQYYSDPPGPPPPFNQYQY